MTFYIYLYGNENEKKQNKRQGKDWNVDTRLEDKDGIHGKRK
jgi:hypothetical protein